MVIPQVSQRQTVISKLSHRQNLMVIPQLSHRQMVIPQVSKRQTVIPKLSHRQNGYTSIVS